MRLFCTFLFSCIITIQASAGGFEANLEEGRLIYRLEKAAWKGTDALLENYAHLRPRLGGYFTYETGAETRCLFYDVSQTNTLILFTFDKEGHLISENTDTVARPLNELESDIMDLRTRTMKRIQSDTSIMQYKNCQFNVVTISEKNHKRSYILTATSAPGYVLIGNDYRIDFDNGNDITEVVKLHQAFLPMKSEGIKQTFHTHTNDTGPYPTPTEVATLLLYTPYTDWESHIILSEKLVTIFDGKQFIRMKRKAWEKIMADR
ncbi:MAG: hypothetical protein WBB45_21125 [Cyclobacteriaceae bacterium]